MIETLRDRSSRPRPSAARLMTWVVACSALLALAASLVRQGPSWYAHGGLLFVGVVCAVLYLPIVPALVIWQTRVSGRSLERNRGAIVVLLLCFLGWLGVVGLTFRTIMAPLGL